MIENCPFCGSTLKNLGYGLYCKHYVSSNKPEHYQCSSGGVGQSGITLNLEDGQIAGFRLVLLPFILNKHSDSPLTRIAVFHYSGQFDYFLRIPFPINWSKLHLPQYRESLIEKIKTLSIFS